MLGRAGRQIKGGWLGRWLSNTALQPWRKHAGHGCRLDSRLNPSSRAELCRWACIPGAAAAAHLGDVGGEAHRRGALAAGVDAAGSQLVHVAALKIAGSRVMSECGLATDHSESKHRRLGNARHSPPTLPCPGPHKALAPEQLRLGHTRVAHQQHVDLAARLGARQHLRAGTGERERLCKQVLPYPGCVPWPGCCRTQPLIL